MGSVRAELAGHASALIEEISDGVTVTFSRTVGQTEDKNAFTLTGGTEETFTLAGMMLSWSVREIAQSNGAILGSDRKAVIVPDERVDASCKITVGGIVYNIVPPIDTRGAGAYMRIQVRR